MDYREYEPDSILKDGYLRIFRDIFVELKTNHWLIFQLFKRDFLSMYKQSFVGVFWAFIIPLISVGTFITLSHSGILELGAIQAPYPVYAILGMALWQLFSNGILASSQSLIKAGPMIVKINFSKKSLVIASFGQSIIAFLIQMSLFFGVVIYYGYQLSWKVLLLPILLIPILLFTLGLGLILSVLNGIFRDIGNVLSVTMTFLLLMTPILYVSPEAGLLAAITELNPLYYLVIVPRDLALSGSSEFMIEYLIVSMISLFLFPACLMVFHITETRITERI